MRGTNTKASQVKQGTEFDNFDRTMRDLMSVPHDEIKPRWARKNARAKRVKKNGRLSWRPEAEPVKTFLPSRPTGAKLTGASAAFTKTPALYWNPRRSPARDTTLRWGSAPSTCSPPTRDTAEPRRHF
jgi:hypothetical protein